jgi:precorrin-6B methylase 2
VTRDFRQSKTAPSYSKRDVRGMTLSALEILQTGSPTIYKT